MLVGDPLNKRLVFFNAHQKIMIERRNNDQVGLFYFFDMGWIGSEVARRETSPHR